MSSACITIFWCPATLLIMFDAYYEIHNILWFRILLLPWEAVMKLLFWSRFADTSNVGAATPQPHSYEAFILEHSGCCLNLSCIPPQANPPQLSSKSSLDLSNNLTDYESGFIPALGHSGGIFFSSNTVSQTSLYEIHLWKLFRRHVIRQPFQILNSLSHLCPMQ